MAGRPRIVRSIQSYINRSDATSGLGPLKQGTAPQIGVSRNYWYNYQTQATPGPLSRINSQAYYQTLQWQTYGNLRPSFVPSPRKSYINYSAGR